MSSTPKRGESPTISRSRNGAPIDKAAFHTRDRGFWPFSATTSSPLANRTVDVCVRSRAPPTSLRWCSFRLAHLSGEAYHHNHHAAVMPWRSSPLEEERGNLSLSLSLSLSHT